MEEWRDEEGYPTEEALAKIREWPYEKQGWRRELMYFVWDLWAYPGFGWHPHADGNRFQISTAGWSGNESLIAAMEDNRPFWWTAFIAERAGGHYWLKIPSLDYSTDQKRAWFYWGDEEPLGEIKCD